MSKTVKTIVWLAGALLVLRLLSAITMGLMPQDAYYHFYGQHLALSYFDHPPMIAYLLRGATELFGSHVVVMKLADFTVTALTLYCFYRLALLHLRRVVALGTTLAFGSTLMVTILSINSTPDVPLLLFWTLSIWLFHLAVFKEKIHYWLLAGLTMGLAFTSKYTAIFLPAGAVAYLLFSVRHRKWLISSRMLLSIAGWLLGAAPVIIWNYQNNWASTSFQSTERASTIMQFNIDVLGLLASQGLQVFLLLPPLFYLLYKALFRIGKSAYVKRRLPSEKTLLLLAFTLPTLGLFLAVGVVYWVKLNWMMPAYVTGAILAGRFLTAKWLRIQLICALVLHVLLFVQIAFYPVLIKSDDTWVGWPELAEEVRTLKAAYPDHFVFANDDYKTSAVLDFYLEEPVYAGNVIETGGKQFHIVYPDLSGLAGRDALFFDSNKSLRDTLPQAEGNVLLETYFGEVRQLDPVLVWDGSGRLLRKFYVYECLDYAPPPPSR